LPTGLGEALRHFERAQTGMASLSDVILGGQDDLLNLLGDRDHYLSQIEREKREIRDRPDVERAEIEVIFTRLGVCCCASSCRLTRVSSSRSALQP